MPILTAWAKFMKTSAIEDPLLKVPPARRGNRSGALSVLLAKRGEPYGGGQFINSERAIGINSVSHAVGKRSEGC
jgi:hypothetical protein